MRVCNFDSQNKNRIIEQLRGPEVDDDDQATKFVIVVIVWFSVLACMHASSARVAHEIIGLLFTVV